MTSKTSGSIYAIEAGYASNMGKSEKSKQDTALNLPWASGGDQGPDQDEDDLDGEPMTEMFAYLNDPTLPRPANCPPPDNRPNMPVN